MAAKVFAIIGCPGSGKTWICEQLGPKFTWLPHDEFIQKMSYDNRDQKGQRSYTQAIIDTAKILPDTIIVIEIPFSVRSITTPLGVAGIDVEHFFICETDITIASRYHSRESKRIPHGHLVRQKTLRERAANHNWFVGTAADILNYLQRL